MISLIAAVSAHTRAIGKDNGLIWDLPADLARFRARTKNHPIIMGRKTWESLPENRRPLPARTNIVVTRNADYEAKGAHAVTSIEDALDIARNSPGAEEIYVIGGGEIYALALPYADELDLTEVDEVIDGDARFPEFEGFTEVSREPTEENGINYDFVRYVRASSAG